MRAPGRGAAWLAHWSGGPGVAGSNPAVPTTELVPDHPLGRDPIARGRFPYQVMKPSETTAGKARSRRRFVTVPNLLSALRLASVPLFVWLFVSGRENAAVIIYGVAAFSDFLDGLIARRTGAVTDLGKLLDPLADRVFIAALAVVLVARGALPLIAAVAVIGRDVLVLGAYPLLERRGAERIPVNAVGKAATASLLFGLTWLALSETTFALGRAGAEVGLTGIVIGAVLYWAAAIMYAREARIRLRALAGNEPLS
jgi:cardiolipin synthase